MIQSDFSAFDFSKKKLLHQKSSKKEGLENSFESLEDFATFCFNCFCFSSGTKGW